MPLTDTFVRTAKPKDKPYKKGDRNGLYLLVNTKGTKYWRYKYRLHKKENVFAIGAYPEVKLADARAAHEIARSQVKAGRNPSHQRKAHRSQQASDAANTFEVIAREWLENARKRWKPNSGRYEAILRLLENRIFPEIGKKAIRDIHARDVLDIIRSLDKDGAPHTAIRAKQVCSSVWLYAVQTLRAESNPVAILSKVITVPPTQHKNPIAINDLGKVASKIFGYRGEPKTIAALNLILLTFVRPGELRSARWNEIDFDRKLWTIPKERMKKSREHLVPLSSQAMLVLEVLKPHTGDKEFLFPNTR